jgi:hypothetical protein
MVEEWNIGYEKQRMSWLWFVIRVIYIGIDHIPLNPVFQYSIIPIPHGIRFRQNLLSLTWAIGPGFRCQNKILLINAAVCTDRK